MNIKFSHVNTINIKFSLAGVDYEKIMCSITYIDGNVIFHKLQR